MDKHFCPYCMTPVPEGESCPSCGLTAGNYVPSPHHLPPGTVLLDRYLVGRVLGEGGFGITYIGCDLRLELKVAIKEYYPVDRATRNSAASLNVSGFIGPSSKSFERGRQKFLDEARTMARMDKQQVIVGVRDFFEANNTAYIVMEYVEGTTFSELKDQRGGRIPPGELFRIIEPLFGALSALHENGLIHRDISPDNLMLENGEVRLLDFGCAREAARGTETMTIALKHGYAPLEQYQQKGQGPWTDIYALCATIYLCLTGQAPPQALDRIAEDNLVLPSKLGVNISPARERALMKGLRIQPNRRYQTVKELWAALYTASDNDAEEPEVEDNEPEPIPIEEPIETEPEAEEPDAEDAEERENPRPKPLAWLKKHRAAVASAAGALVLAAVLLIVLWPKGAATPDMTDNTPRESGAPVFAPAEEGDPGETESPDAPAIDPDDRFANAAEISGGLSHDDFTRLMEDDSVPALIWSNADAEYNSYTITKPVRVTGGGFSFSSLTITETGYLEVENYDHEGESAFTVNALLRLEGAGERIHLDDPDMLFMPWESTIWADAEENLGNIAEAIHFEIPTILYGSLDELNAQAIHVTTEEELLAAAEGDVPVCVAADIYTAEDVFFSAPLIVPEGVTLSTPSAAIQNEGSVNLNGRGGVLLNYGTITGKLSAFDGARALNYGLIDRTEGEDKGTALFFDGASLVNDGTVYADQASKINLGGNFTSYGAVYANDLYLIDTAMDNLGELYIGGGAGLQILGGSTLNNFSPGLTVLDPGTSLFNNSRIFNQGEFRVNAGASLWNTMFQNDGTLIVKSGADVTGGGFIGVGVFYWGDGAPDNCYPTLNTGADTAWRDVYSEAELRSILAEGGAQNIRITTEIHVSSDLTIGYEEGEYETALYIDGGSLVMDGNWQLNLFFVRAQLDNHATIEGNVFICDSAVVFQRFYSDECGIVIPDGGNLTVGGGSYLGGNGLIYPGAGATVNLEDGSTLCLERAVTDEDGFSGFTLNIVRNSTLITEAEFKMGSYGGDTVINIEDGGAFRPAGNVTELVNCRVSLAEGSTFYTATHELTISDCRVDVSSGSTFHSFGSDLSLLRGSYIFVDDSTLDTLDFDGNKVNVSADSTIELAGDTIWKVDLRRLDFSNAHGTIVLQNGDEITFSHLQSVLPSGNE